MSKGCCRQRTEFSPNFEAQPLLRRNIQLCCLTHTLSWGLWGVQFTLLQLPLSPASEKGLIRDISFSRCSLHPLPVEIPRAWKGSTCTVSKSRIYPHKAIIFSSLWPAEAWCSAQKRDLESPSSGHSKVQVWQWAEQLSLHILLQLNIWFLALLCLPDPCIFPLLISLKHLLFIDESQFRKPWCNSVLCKVCWNEYSTLLKERKMHHPCAVLVNGTESATKEMFNYTATKAYWDPHHPPHPSTIAIIKLIRKLVFINQLIHQLMHCLMCCLEQLLLGVHVS